MIQPTTKEEQRTEVIKTICIGIVSENMLYANQTLVVRAGTEIFNYIGKMTYKDFNTIKKQAKKVNQLRPHYSIYRKSISRR